MRFLAWCGRQRVRAMLVLATVPALAVACVTGYASWGHIVEVGLGVGEPSAEWLPVAIDGMMLTGTCLAVVDRLRGYEPRGWSIVALWLGSAMTVTFNVLSAVQRGPGAMAVASIYAITFLVTIEAIFHPSQILLGRTARAVKRNAKLAHKLAQAEEFMSGLVPHMGPGDKPNLQATDQLMDPGNVSTGPASVPTVPAFSEAPSPVPVSVVPVMADREPGKRRRRASNGPASQTRGKGTRPRHNGAPSTDLVVSERIHDDDVILAEVIHQDDRVAT